MTKKLDFKRTYKPKYTGKVGRWDDLVIPSMPYAMVDGQGDPGGPDFGKAIAALYSVAYGVKFKCKAAEQDFTVPPLEALWMADDPTAFVRNDRAAWVWTAMIRLPKHVLPDMLEQVRETALGKLAKKKDPPTDADTLGRVYHGRLEEGRCLQTLHVGPYTNEAATLAHLHDELMPGQGLTFNGPHHEIYLSDARRVAPEKLKTILRQPVVPK
ncbi:GyrI-like domain-containing protein [Parasedimentitalea maritima]|uniref:GyrI-like small molecule binding domain-containing protein n=1 Tax=Parasedimentitalea maritima TaxID=2578117 RepID=A0A6A4RND5_9RHOB|nr:GyrI-like domain-containing protein [Zongyanglinia marina]KAE9632501.1 hypothetical protein GP644_01615 [Zongyanglinia marina]